MVSYILTGTNQRKPTLRVLMTDTYHIIVSFFILFVMDNLSIFLVQGIRCIFIANQPKDFYNDVMVRNTNTRR